MTELLDMYKYAEQRDIEVDWFPLPVTPSLSVKLPDNRCAWLMRSVTARRTASMTRIQVSR